jgi:hypothetical protein
MSLGVNSPLSLRASKLALITVSLFGVLSVLYKRGNDFQGSSVTRLVERRAKTTLPDRKTLIWLLGYPGAGTDATINMIERATQKSMATNYGSTVQTRDMGSVTNVYVSQWLQKVWYKEGVFINNIDYPADTPQVYVRTFCTGHCLYDPDSGFCPRIPYVRQLLDVGRFWEECARGDIYLPPRTRKWNKTYWRNRVKKVLVLVRNPMEIVASRFMVYARHNGLHKARVAGLLPWCEMVDNLYKDVKEVQKMTARRNMREIVVDGVPEGIPCWTEFFRIYYWYANAWEIADGRESMVKYYEDFINDPIGTATDILDYAGLTRVEGKEIRPIGDQVNMMFTDEEKEKISVFMQALGRGESPMWPEYFARYF